MGNSGVFIVVWIASSVLGLGCWNVAKLLVERTSGPSTHRHATRNATRSANRHATRHHIGPLDATSPMVQARVDAQMTPALQPMTSMRRVLRNR